MIVKFQPALCRTLSKQIQLKPPFIAVFACLLLATGTAVSAKGGSSYNELTQQGIHLYEQDQAQEAIDLELQAVKKKRTAWLPHALLSYFLWHESKPQEAIVEGKLAAKLAPHMPVLLINLGIIEQLSGDLQSAVDCFGKARALAPTDWRAWIGQAQSLMLVGRVDESASILQEMGAQTTNDFNWYYELAQTYLFLDRPGLAADAASKANTVASTPQQKSDSLFQLFVSCVRDNQIERANALKHQVFCDNKPTDAQIYIQAASSLLPVLDPAAADEIFDAAVANLARPTDSETFLRLARIFEEKASYVSYDRTKYGAWLESEEAAYRQAIKLNSSPAIYHLGLASVLGQKGKAEEMTLELDKAWAIDAHDQLTGYLLSKLKPVQIPATGQIAATEPSGATEPSAATRQQLHLTDSSAASPRSKALALASHVHLTEAKIGISGLSCACKLNIVANSFRQIKGLVLTTMSPKYPYKSTILIDQSMIPMSEALAQMNKKKPFPQLTYELISTRPIESAGEALQIDVDGRPLNYPMFATQFNQLQATLPVAVRAAVSN